MQEFNDSNMPTMSRARSKPLQGELPIDMPPAGTVPPSFANDPQVATMYSSMSPNTQQAAPYQQSYQKDNNVYHQQDPIESYSTYAPNQEVYETPSYNQVESEPEEYEEIQEEAPIAVKSAPDNFKTMREAWERDKRQWEKEKEFYMQQMMQTRPVTPNIPAKQEEDDDLPIQIDASDDDIADIRTTKKVAEGLNKKSENRYQKLSKKYEETEKRITKLTADLELRRQFPDYDAVINADNLANFESQYEDEAASMSYNPNYYQKAVAVYKAMKRYGYGAQQSNQPTKVNRSPNADLIMNNMSKPRNSSGVKPQRNASPLSMANAYANMSPAERDAQAVKDMNAAIASYRPDY
jgi:hypothetical protein